VLYIQNVVHRIHGMCAQCVLHRIHHMCCAYKMWCTEFMGCAHNVCFVDFITCVVHTKCGAQNSWDVRTMCVAQNSSHVSGIQNGFNRLRGMRVRCVCVCACVSQKSSDVLRIQNNLNSTDNMLIFQESATKACTLFHHSNIAIFHTIKPTNALTLKLYFLRTICHNSDIFRAILIIFRELLNII